MQVTPLYDRLLVKRFTEEEKTKALKRGRGSQKKTKVLVMVESEHVENPKNPQKPKRVNHLKMVVIPDLKAETIDQEAIAAIDKDAKITTDGSTSYTNFKDHFAQHDASVVLPKEVFKCKHSVKSVFCVTAKSQNLAIKKSYVLDQ